MKELLSNLPNYPPETSSTSQQNNTKQKTEHADKRGATQHHQSHNISAPAKVVYRNDDVKSRDTRMGGVDVNAQANIHAGGSSNAGLTSNSRRTRPVTAYDILQNNNALYGMVKQEENDPR